MLFRSEFDYSGTQACRALKAEGIETVLLNSNPATIMTDPDVADHVGMNAWIADVVLPSSVPENIFLFALLVAALSMIIHMFMGSVMAVLGVCVPAFISFAAGSSVSPLAVALIVFTSINIHYILPFHNLPILIGEGKDAGGYTSKEAMRMGIPLTAVVFIVVLVEAAWFHLFGLM